uniref:YceI family protein n=1 Tax=Gelidibacter sp. TaxID=2018083 RepID=UPI004049C345
MKTNILKSALVLVIAASVASFTSISDRKVNINESKVNWKGYKVTGEHEGTINLKEGSLTFTDNQLTGGSFVIDMTTINTTDLSGGSKEKLDGHLKSDDFFGVAKFPTASFKITSVNGKDKLYRVTGDLTIKGITKSTSFALQIADDQTATAALKIDRTKFGIEYQSSSFIENLKDKAIYDEFDLNVTLKYQGSPK